MARRRFRVDEATGEVVEDKLDCVPEPEPVESEAERKRREQDERDAHPGVYL